MKKLKMSATVIECTKAALRNVPINKKPLNHKDFSWHEWFAWYPVSLMGGVIFFRTVERIRVRSARLNIAYWVYREVGERPDYKPACAKMRG